MQHSLNYSPSRTGPVLPPGIDILHELGNRALSGSKKPRRRRTLETFDHREPLLPLCDASATGSTVRCHHEQDIVDPPSIIKLFPGASLRYTPGGLRRGDTHARGGRTPHPTGYARGSAHSEAPRRARRGLPRATWLLEAPAATARKSARIA